MNTQFNKSQSGISRAQWLVIVAVVIVGAALAFLILTTRKQVDANPFDDDGPRPTATTTAAVPKEMNQVLMDEAQIKASDIHVASAGPLAISTILQFPGEIQINDDRTVHVVPRVSGVAEAVLVSTGQIVKKGQTLAVFSSQMISEQCLNRTIKVAIKGNNDGPISSSGIKYAKIIFCKSDVQSTCSGCFIFKNGLFKQRPPLIEFVFKANIEQG